MGLAVTICALVMNPANAQTKQTKQNNSKRAADTKAVEAKRAEEARLASIRAEEEKKSLEAKRLEEAKAAAEKAKIGETSTGVLGYVKSHFGASYHGEYYFFRKDIFSTNEDDHKIQDFAYMHNPTITYRPIKNVKFLVTSEFKYIDNGNKGTFINRHYRSLVSLTKENVLVEKEDGLKLDVGIARRVFDRNHGLAGSYGNSRVNASIGKKLSDSLTTSTMVQYMANDPAKGKIGPNTWKHAFNLLPSLTWKISDKITYFFNDDFVIYTPWHKDTYDSVYLFHEMNIAYITYQFDDKNSTYFQYKYLRVPGAGFSAQPNVDDHFEYYIGYGHNITPKVTVTAEVGSTIFKAQDGRDFFAKNVKYPEFALYLDMSL